MQSFRILIQTPTSSISQHLSTHLRSWGYKIVGTANSYEQACQMYLEQQPDLSLIDLPTGCPSEGVALAGFIKKQENSQPFIFLSKGPDRQLIELIKETLPAGFITKPIRPELLQASVILALHKHASQHRFASGIKLMEGEYTKVLPLQKILYLEADHVYVHLHTAEGKRILQRRSLTELLDSLPADDFVQTHRSFVVNVRQLSHWDNKHVYVGEQAVPLSRSRRKAVLARLSAMAGN